MKVPPPHLTEATLRAGDPIESARQAVVLVHGRGGSARDMRGLTPYLKAPDCVYVLPWATGHTWYPASFLAPEARNQPGLDSGLALIHHTLEELESRLDGPEAIHLVGFSQGACLVLEAAARRPRRYGSVNALSGGLIGLGDNLRAFSGTFEGAPILLSCSDHDPHIPAERVRESARVLESLGAEVTVHLRPGSDHTVEKEDLDLIQTRLQGS